MRVQGATTKLCLYDVQQSGVFSSPAQTFRLDGWLTQQSRLWAKLVVLWLWVPNRRAGDWESAQVPNVLRRNRGIFSLRRLAERRCWRPEKVSKRNTLWVKTLSRDLMCRRSQLSLNKCVFSCRSICDCRRCSRGRAWCSLPQVLRSTSKSFSFFKKRTWIVAIWTLILFMTTWTLTMLRALITVRAVW